LAGQTQNRENNPMQSRTARQNRPGVAAPRDPITL
jgi:hypothetical protein